MFNRLPGASAWLAVSIEALLHGIEQMLMLPFYDPPLTSGGVSRLSEQSKQAVVQ